MSQSATLYLHFPCFDGVISSVLAADFLERQGWKIQEFCPVNYHLRENWLSTHLKKPCAVVDFLYHPDAEFWADHHLTSFLSDNFRAEFFHQSQDWKLYDSGSGSCASLLWQKLLNGFGVNTARFKEMKDWAEKIDSAGYASVEEAIMGDAPALQIRASLLRGADNEYCSYLIGVLREKSLAAAADLPEIQSRFEEVRRLTSAGLKRFREAARLENGRLVTFDLDDREDDIVSRYAPFYFFRKARYSIGIIRGTARVKITAMRNPWLNFPSVSLGSLFARYGGGGHERVGSVALGKERCRDSEDILRKLISEIETNDAAPRVLTASA